MKTDYKAGDKVRLRVETKRDYIGLFKVFYSHWGGLLFCENDPIVTLTWSQAELLNEHGCFTKRIYE